MFTSFDPNDLIVKKTRLDVWQYELTGEIKKPLLLLDEEEKARASRFYFSKHRNRFILARATMRLILGKYLQHDPKNLSFSYGFKGKPTLKNAAFPLEFNLSHSKDTALLAIGQTPLGVDIEYFSERPYEGIGKQLFSPEELKAFYQVSEEAKQSAFFQLWAKKEAFIKALGLGLSYPTKEFTLTLQQNKIDRIIDSIEKKCWHVCAFKPKVDAWAALCYSPFVDEFRLNEFNPYENSCFS